MHEDVMGKIYDFKTKKLIADLPKYDFLEVPEEIVNGDGPLTKAELDLISDAVHQSEMIINMCNDNEESIFMWHDNYLAKLCARMERSLQSKRNRNA
jgi:hypothetical protein